VLHKLMQQDPIVPVGPAETNRPTPLISRPPHDRKKSILPTIGVLIGAPLVALLLTLFVFQSYEVDGPSMETTLQHQDRLIVWKLPKTWAKITNNHYLPERGDIIIFVKKGLSEIDNSGSGEKQLIKRVIGVQGDRVVVNDGRITVYNDEHKEGYNPDAGQEFSEHITSYTSGKVDMIVGENEVFVAGDNRTNSLDSRSFGPVSSDDIVGKLVFRILPANKFDSYL
jgi:signal peptidase I